MQSRRQTVQVHICALHSVDTHHGQMLAMQGDIPLKTLKVIESYWRSPGLAGTLADKGEFKKKKSTLISLHINYDLLFLKL